VKAAYTIIASTLFLLGGLSPAAAEIRLTEGFILDNMTREVCQVGPNYDPMMDGMFTRMRGFDEMSNDDGVVTFTHPDQITLVHLPNAVEGPTCVMTIEGGVVDDAMFEDYLAITTNYIRSENRSGPVTTGDGDVWSWKSDPDFDSNIVWSTTLTRSNTGRLQFDIRPLTPEGQ